MSYDIWLAIDTGGEHEATVCEVGNMTSNVSGMWRFALGYPLSDLRGVRAGDAINDLEKAVACLWAPVNRAALDAMAPANGWGDLTGAREYLQKLLDACRTHPAGTVRMWV